MFGNPIHRLRLVSVLEATAVLLLVAATVVSATGGPSVGVVLAVITAAFLVAYVVQALAVSRLLRWSGWQTFVILAAALVPFAPYTIERWLSDQERHTVTA